MPRHTKFWQRQSAQFGALIADLDNEPNAKEIHGKMETALGLFREALAADDNSRESKVAAYRTSLVDAAIAIQGTKLARVTGPSLTAWLQRVFIAEVGLPAPPELDEQCTIERFSPDSPLRVLEDGQLVPDAGTVPDMRHLQQWRDYLRSLVPEGRVGRPRGSKKQKGSGRPLIDPDKARRAARMSADGANLPKIADAVGVDYNRYDPKDTNRARSKVTRLVERGRLNQGQP